MAQETSVGLSIAMDRDGLHIVVTDDRGNELAARDFAEPEDQVVRRWLDDLWPALLDRHLRPVEEVAS